MATPVSTAPNSPVEKTSNTEYNGNDTTKSMNNSNGSNAKLEKEEPDTPLQSDMRFETDKVTNVPGLEADWNFHSNTSANTDNNQNTMAIITLQDNTLDESSPDNLDEVKSAVLTSAKEAKKQGSNISKKLKRSLSYDSTVRKSYRAGILETMGSNSSLDKDIQQEITTEQLDDKNLSGTTAKRKLSFGDSKKRRLSAGKKLFGNFLTVPGRKPLQVSRFTATKNVRRKLNDPLLPPQPYGEILNRTRYQVLNSVALFSHCSQIALFRVMKASPVWQWQYLNPITMEPKSQSCPVYTLGKGL